VWGASDWYFEADGDGRVTRQATVYDRGDRVLKYDMANPSDEFGMLEVELLDLDEFAAFEIAESAFEAAWAKEPPSPPPPATLPVRRDVFDNAEALTTRYLGTIHQLSGMSARERTLAIFDSAIVEARGSDLAAIGRLGGPVGAELMRNKAKRRADEEYADADPRALANADSGNRLISLDAVTQATLSKTKVGLYRELALTLADGSTVTYSWQPAHNGDDATVPLLWSALGPRLTSSV
jgi:hypothetical protein